MKYSFKDINNEEMYETAQVIIVTGQYNIFNNIVSDKIKEKCKPDDELEIDEELFSEFGVDTSQIKAEYKSNSVDFNTFTDIVGTPNINGKWFCSVNIDAMTKKQLDYLDSYIKSPNKNGVLVIVAQEYRQFMWYLKNKALQLSKVSHIIQLGFPTRAVLKGIVIQLFNDRGVAIDEKSAELFIMRLSTVYDNYETTIDKITTGYNDTELTYKDMERSLKGINNYMIDDFLVALLSPIGTDKIKTNRKIYKMYESLISDMGADKLIKELKKKVALYREFRLAINDGIIPVKVRYSTEEVKKELGKESKLYNIVDFKFKQMAYTASLTSLKDWTYICMILSDTNRDSKHSEKLIYTLVHRTTFSQSRLNNNLRIESVLENQLKALDSIKYTK